MPDRDWPSEAIDPELRGAVGIEEVLSEANAALSNPPDSVGIPVSQLIGEPVLAKLDVRVFAGQAGFGRAVRSARIQKSGLALVGHLHGVEAWRVQILGATEISFLESLSPDERLARCREFARIRPCGVVVTRGVVPPNELVVACDETDTPLIGMSAKSSSTINVLHALLDDKLAPRTRIHGVLVSMFGVGVLLLGRSGIGKSECALDLVMRGHRLVADDVVDCAYRPQGIVLGAAAALLEHHIEIRGLGVLNVKDLFGVTSVAERVRIDLVVRLSDVQDVINGLEYDRLGLDERHHTILGVRIPEVTVPVRPGRDIASILEIAARNELLKRAGHHGAKEFRDRLERALLGNATPIPAPGPLSEPVARATMPQRDAEPQRQASAPAEGAPPDDPVGRSR